MTSGPERTCVGCRKIAQSSELLRYARTPDGVRQGRALPGRGAWLCRDQECLQKALAKGSLARSLGVPAGSVAADLAVIAAEATQ
ncbi:MAG TPA: YlxR family protein [Microthrixaceae bacterium]|nr:YlxR family protein [Microthrixaceae bacterium]